MNINWLEDNSGQINIDFLAGISIFLISFLLAIQLVPNLFIPFQGQPVTLHSVGYRTSVILCEDPGWYNGTVNVSGNYTISNGINWEDHPDNISRLGLAQSKFSSNLSNPMTLSGVKIMSLAGIYNSSDPDSYSKIQDQLGLTTSYRKYDYNISLIRFGSSPSSYLNGTPILQIGKIPPSNVDVEKVERIISLDMYGFGNIGSTYEFIDSPSTKKFDNINLTVPIGAARIYIEKRNSNATETPFASATVTNDTSTVNILNETYLAFPVIIDLTEDINKYDDPDHQISVDLQFKNIFGYYYFSNAGDLVGDQLAANIVVQVW